jgi:hypothetical protein
MLHERDRITADTAAEALKETAIRMDVERGRLLGMKRAQADQIVSALAQRHVLTNQLRDVYARADFAKGTLVKPHRPLFVAAAFFSVAALGSGTAAPSREAQP